MVLRLPGVEPGSIAWKAIILTVGLQTLVYIQLLNITPEQKRNFAIMLHFQIIIIFLLQAANHY